MRKNTTRTPDGAEVYTHKIYSLADAYIETLGTTPEKQAEQIKKAPVFRGMLKHIYMQLFKPTDGRKENSCIDYTDIDAIDAIWNIYTSLCYQYNHNPTILNFSIMVGIGNDTINTWKTGKLRDDIGKNGQKRSATVKKWFDECEAAAYDVAMGGNPGGMFVLKACYGYVEQPQQLQIVGPQTQQTAAEIAERYSSTALLPEPERPEL